MDQPTAERDRKLKNGADGGGSSNDLAVIREQTRETLALLRQLIDMLLPKGDPDKPKLEDLIAALVGQQARILMLIQQIGADLKEALERLETADGGRQNGHRVPPGLRRS